MRNIVCRTPFFNLDTRFVLDGCIVFMCCERKVFADGTFQNDQFIFWLRKTLGRDRTLTEPRPLYSDAEVIAEAAHTEIFLTASEIATRYTYPQKYVDEVLWPQIQAARDLQTISI